MKKKAHKKVYIAYFWEPVTLWRYELHVIVIKFNICKNMQTYI